MPRRTQLFQKIPWTGGVNSSVDPGVLPSGDLVQADNVEFTTSGTRKKRQGFSYFDTSIPAVIKRSSSGTTRTLVFASSISKTSPTDQIIVVGEQLKVASAGDTHYNSAVAIVASIATTTITNDTITYTFSGATSLSESLIADTAAVVTKSHAYIGVLDFWYFNSSNNAKTQEHVAFSELGRLFKFDSNGRRIEIVASGAGATALASTPIARVCMRAFGNKIAFAMTGVGNTPKYYDPMVANEWKDMPGAPDASILMEYQGRLFADNKLNLDNLEFCAPFDMTQWQGIGDSGAIPISQGDGDPVGLSAIYPPYKKILFLAKGTKLFSMSGQSPETYFIDAMTNGVGAASHQAAVAFDMDDVFYFSKRGVHSLVATANYGDFSGKYSSRRIQPTYNSWSPATLKMCQGTYLPSLNCVAWTVAEQGNTKPNAIWLYNPTIGEEENQETQAHQGERGVWFRWPNIDAQSLTTVLQSDVTRPMCGTSTGRVMIGDNGTYTDFANSAIPFRVKSGAIYVDNNPQTVKAFKKVTLLFKPRGRYNFTAYFTVDNMPSQALVFGQNVQGDKLGTAFRLGSSTLGSNPVLAPFTKDVVGHGRGCTLEIFQTGVEAQVEIYGFMIEYELADLSEDVNLGGSTNVAT